MIKTKKYFVQKLYKNLLTVDEEIITKNPNNIKKDNNLLGIRYYEQEIITIDGKTYQGIKENYSPWIYFGKRMSIEQVKNLCKINSNFNLTLKLMEENNINYICFTQLGTYIPLEADNLTFEELQEKYQNKQLIKINTFNKSIRKAINTQISCIILKKGKQETIKGKLTNYEENDSVTIDNKLIPFISEDTIIISIKNNQNKTIYTNQYQNLPLTYQIEEIFGYEFLNNLIKEQKENEKIWNNSIETIKDKEEIKHIYIELGRNYIKPKELKKWINFVNNNYKNTNTIKTTINILNLINTTEYNENNINILNNYLSNLPDTYEIIDLITSVSKKSIKYKKYLLTYLDNQIKKHKENIIKKFILKSIHHDK